MIFVESIEREYSIFLNITVSLTLLNSFGVGASCTHGDTDYTLDGLRKAVPAALQNVKGSTILGSYSSCLNKMGFYRSNIEYGSEQWKC